MRSELAERLLGALMDWDVPRFGVEIPRLQAIASLKYDEYGGYRAGVKFAENLAQWLEQFQTSERNLAYSFVMSRLVFISDAEMSHLIEIAYRDFVEPRLLARTAGEAGESPHRVRRLAESPEFIALRRRSLVLGISDGARLDRLRRATPLSHEQFSQGLDLDSEEASRLQSELQQALMTQSLPGDPTFRQIFLVDDFSGSGRTLIRRDETTTGGLKGKLWRFKGRLEDLIQNRILSRDVAVNILLYTASEQAVEHVREMCEQAGLGGWKVDVIQLIPRSMQVDRTDPSMTQLCRDYYDPSTVDQHKKATPLGYEDCALPLVLTHNAPNNSVCLIWAETSEDEGLGRRALFPRYERHHKDRP